MGKPNTGKHDKKGWAKKKDKHGGSDRRHQTRGTEDDDGSDFEEVGQSSEMRTGVYFSESDSDGDVNDEKGSFEQEQKDTRQLVQQQNRKKKKSGGFQSMGLSHPVFKGVLRKGYKVPTPIQRKTIPVIMDGRDVVAMARTGSGKTAAFLIPMFERLKAHTAKAGARAMILSPTRELALQTLKFAKELGKYTGLRAAVILGGDSMEDQFAALHENPDIIIATPGRFMHVLVEMELRLEFVEYVVFDEADRLFEMGFQEQLHEILQRLPEARQTLLFSATLPRLLVEFAKAGLHDPMLVRLDVDTKLSENLQLAFLQCRSEDKAAVLLHLLRNVLKPSEQAVIFTATKHHVEYLNMLLGEAGIECSYSYSALDPLARKINVAKFRNKKTMVLLVTDLAARGIDIPMLDVVINYNFPAKPKLFVHRVGRVARAGRTGTAYSIVGPDEVPFVLDLHLFLGRPMKYATSTAKEGEDGLYGMVPQRVVDEGDENLQVWHQKLELSNMKRVITNAYKQYVRSRPAPSAESVKRMKATDMNEIAVHPVFGQSTLPAEQEREKMLNTMRTYRPNITIFETSSTKKTQASEVMKSKRQRHGAVIMENLRKAELKKENSAANSRDISERAMEVGEDIDLQEVFSDVVAPRVPSGNTEHHGKKKRQPIIDEENYLSYRPKDFQSEKGLSLGTSFEQEAASAAMDLVGDEDQHNRKVKSQMKWDRKRKRFVRESDSGPGKKKVKTESGTWIKASYKSNLYKEWLNRSKAGDKDEDSGDEDKPHQSQNTSRLQILGSRGRGRGRGRGFRGRGEYRGTQRQPDRGSERGGKSAGRGRGGHGKPQRGKRYHNELKSSEEILHKRRKTAKLRSFMKFREQKHKKTKSVAGKKKK